MSGAIVTKLPRKAPQLETMILTPELATALLEHNGLNRPLSQPHVNRIAKQIAEGKWKFNGETIKIADTNDVLDGQHRLWAVIEAKTPIETILVRGIKKEAFATIDTLRKPRSGGDTIALGGQARYRNIVAAALTWMTHWQRKHLENMRAPQNRVENSDVELAFADNPGIVRAVERAIVLRRLANPGVMAFIYYTFTNRNPELAERMMATLEDPSGVSVSDPFFRLRSYFTADHHKKKDPLVTIALAIKAANAAHQGMKLSTLSFRTQGKNPETFPVLDIGKIA